MKTLKLCGTQTMINNILQMMQWLNYCHKKYFIVEEYSDEREKTNIHGIATKIFH